MKLTVRLSCQETFIVCGAPSKIWWGENRRAAWTLEWLCRCCHADGNFNSLNSSYQGKNDVEIYETMLRETLGISISTEQVPLVASHTICDSCIFKLRNATEFKKQVLMCEEKFKFYCNNEQLVITSDVKSEGENDECYLYHDLEIDENRTLDVTKEYNIEVDINHPIEEVETENIPEIENVNIVSEHETEKESEIPKKNVKTEGNSNRQEFTDTEEEHESRGNLDHSLIVQVDTDRGSHFSCKDCGGLYYKVKDINRHIFKAHLTFYKCDFCPTLLKSFETLQNHLKLHTGKEFNCSFCPKAFASKHALKDHLNCHTKEKIYKCHLCEKKFKYNQTLVRHLQVHAGTNKKILCDLCGRSFNDRSNLDAHIRTVHERQRPFQCKICQKSYSNKRHLKDHLKLHNGDKERFECDVCDQKRSCPKTMKIHKLKHENAFMCKYCSVIFDDAASKIEHVKAVHNKGLPWLPCPTCGKVFSGKFSLNRHIDEHKGIKKFPCDVCGLKFTQKVVLNRHKFRKHNPEANIVIGKTKCDICKRSFKNIVVHMDKHNNRLCACEICGTMYPDTSALNRHKSLKHFGRSFDCGNCEKKYLKKSSLNKHRMKAHQINVEKDCGEGLEKLKVISTDAQQATRNCQISPINLEPNALAI